MKTKRTWATLATLATLLLAGIALAATGGRIEGKLLDAATGKGISGDTCKASGASATTGADGGFTLAATGKQRVRCTKSGYLAATATVSVPHDGVGKVTLKMQRQAPKPVEPEPVAQPEAEEKLEMLHDSRSRDMSGAAGAASKKATGRRGPRRPRKHMKRKMRPRPSKPMMIARPSPDPMPTPHDTEEYAHETENDFRSPTTEPLSTFSIDVDTASYANTRRFINQSRIPPADAVRIEEFVNYFKYDYPDAKDEHPFSITTEISTAPWNPKHRLVHVGLQGKKVETAKLPPSNLVFLLDVSGSMNNANKLPLLKAAFKLLVNNLRPHDRVAIVVYAGAAGVVLPSTPGKQKGLILAAIDKLRAGGSTAGGAGIKLAYAIAEKNFHKGGNNRVILATDGDFNVGTSSTGELTRLVEEKRKTGVFLTILGFGSGNYKDSRMEELSNKGNGNAAYIDSILEAKKVLVTEMGGTLLTIAKDVKIQVEFNPAKVKGYRLIGYVNRKLANQDFADDKKDAGELGAGHSVTVLYEIIPAGSDEPVKGAAELKYQKRAASSAADSDELMTVKLRYKKPDGDKSTLIVHPLRDFDLALAKTSDNFRFSAAVAGFGMLLRKSKHKGDATFDAIRTLAKGAVGPDTFGYRGEFVQLVEKAGLLASTR